MYNNPFLKQTIDAWKNVFLLTSLMLTGSGILYVLFSESNCSHGTVAVTSCLIPG